MSQHDFRAKLPVIPDARHLRTCFAWAAQSIRLHAEVTAMIDREAIEVFASAGRGERFLRLSSDPEHVEGERAAK